MGLQRWYDGVAFWLLSASFEEFILAHKLVAGREKDLDDIDALCRQLGIKNRKKAQKILDTYIYQDIQDNSDVMAILDDFFSQQTTDDQGKSPSALVSAKKMNAQKLGSFEPRQKSFNDETCFVEIGALPINGN